MNFNQLKKHAFFKAVPWHDLRLMQPPFKPVISHDADTRYFDKVKDVDLAIDSPVEPDSAAEAAAAAAAAAAITNEKKDVDSERDMWSVESKPKGHSPPSPRNKKPSSFNNIDPKGVDGIATEGHGKAAVDGAMLSIKSEQNHFYGFTFERIPIEKQDLFADDADDEADADANAEDVSEQKYDGQQ
ncbi:hypothetical protein RFI_16463 [Reticulomyxa filosa]|uniref:AGC-kinase C-terminal domain-containing protein n=1 Tax=Reticulomyxa filosa TaxID=46433 RepID=X6N4R2_RETFI|nr:hypothetical protein RFI_16463 [Reticulomyxa filosa]|eukprot:ETO20754.1 hypothetical protein RFI_16463 [Reticulomyxa filosa]